MFFLKDTTDFSPKNITLPECDMDDIDLLIGSDNISDELTDPIDRVRRTNEAIKLNINENLGEAEIILNEVEEIRRILMTAKP